MTCQIKHIIGYPKFKKKFEKVWGELPSHRAKKKLKSCWHYLVNNDIESAWHFYLQLYDCYEEGHSEE
jgi:hypothetical protein